MNMYRSDSPIRSPNSFVSASMEIHGTFTAFQKSMITLERQKMYQCYISIQMNTHSLLKNNASAIQLMRSSKKLLSYRKTSDCMKIADCCMTYGSLVDLSLTLGIIRYLLKKGLGCQSKSLFAKDTISSLSSLLNQKSWNPFRIMEL